MKNNVPMVYIMGKLSRKKTEATKFEGNESFTL